MTANTQQPYEISRNRAISEMAQALAAVAGRRPETSSLDCQNLATQLADLGDDAFYTRNWDTTGANKWFARIRNENKNGFIAIYNTLVGE